MKVVLPVFSGNAGINPAVALSSLQIGEFSRLRSRLDPIKLLAPRGLVHPLGYSGFMVHSDSLPLMHIHSGRVGYSTQEMELWLLELVKDQLSPSVQAYVKTQIETGANPSFINQPAGARTSPLPKIIDPNHPIYQPAEWNTDSVQPYNNCYNYASNDPTGTFAQPGRGSGHVYQQIDADAVAAGAVSDGLVHMQSWGDQVPQGWRVCLVIWPGEDFHWYRQDFPVTPGAAPTCSHKPGSTEVRNVDNKGQIIIDPTAASCDHGPYTIVAGPMNVPGRELIAIQ